MKTIFKLFVFGLVSAFIASSLTGCGGKKKPEADPVGPDIAAPADAGEDFNSWQKTTAIRAAIDEGRISQAKSMALKRIDSQPEDASAHYFLGRCLLEEGELNKARHSLTTAMKLDMGNRAYEREMGRCMSLMADDFLKRQMPSEAIANLKQAVSYGYKPRETEGKLAGAYKNTVDELLNSGNLVEAENLLRDSINLLPDRPELRVALAELLIEGDRLMEAERMLKSLTITNPDYEKGLNAYARLLYRMGEVSAAREMIDKSLKIAPADSEAIEIKNMLEQNVPVVKSPVEEQLTPQGAKELIADLDSLGKYAEQKRVLEQLIERYPEETWAYLALGRINDKLELYDEAFVNISEYLDRHPDSAEGKFQLARIQKQKGELESSLMLLQEISEKLNDKVSLLNESGQVYARMGRFDEAREHWNRALNLSEDNSESYFNLGQLAMETGDNKGAQEYFEKALRLSPDNAKFKYFAGLNLIQSGLKEQANNFWKASRDSLNPEDPYAERILRVIGEEQPQQSVQVQTLDPINMPVVQVPSSVINEAPVDSADYNRALEYARAGYFNEAINGFRQVLQDNPNHFNAIMNLGKVYSVSGDSAKSCALYLKALKLNSSNLFALRSLANAYSEAGLHSFASEVTTQAQSSFPGQTEGFPTYKVARSAVRNSPRAFRPVVHALISEGLNQEALAVAQTGVAEQPESAEMMLLQGEVYKALGQYETSLESYRKALQMEPQNPKPYMLTGDLLVAAGQFTNAADEYHKALKAGFIDPDTMFEIVDRFESLGRTVDAKRVLGRLKGMNLNQSQIAKLEAHLGEKIDVSQEDN